MKRLLIALLLLPLLLPLTACPPVRFKAKFSNKYAKGNIPAVVKRRVIPTGNAETRARHRDTQLALADALESGEPGSYTFRCPVTGGVHDVEVNGKGSCVVTLPFGVLKEAFFDGERLPEATAALRSAANATTIHELLKRGRHGYLVDGKEWSDPLAGASGVRVFRFPKASAPRARETAPEVPPQPTPR